MKKKVAIGLSGGVDSAVAALLLQDQGYDVHCIYLNCFDKDIPGCRTKEDRKDALAVALHLGLPFQVLDLRKEYQESVIDYFKREYEASRTPNPDVVCNRDIKFGLFYQWAIAQQHFDFLATGHYADVSRFFQMKKSAGTPASRQRDTMTRGRRPREWRAFDWDAPILRIPLDLHKDQTYFLWQVPRERFSRVLFPLGDYLKSEVRAIARDAKLPVADKQDSTGICFIGEVRVEDFLKRLGVKDNPGEVIDTSGNIIGKHRGVIFYTIGQRHGFSTDLWSSKNKEEGKRQKEKGRRTVDRPPLYVIEKDVEHNRLVVGFGAETYREKFFVSDVNWMTFEKVGPWRTPRSDLTKLDCFVRIRHGGELIPASLEMVNGRWLMDKRSSIIHHPSSIRVRLREPQRGIAPGQSAVFYSEDGIVLGGGVIQSPS